MHTETLAEQIASIASARHNCLDSGNTEWALKHSDALRAIEKQLPSGAGIDCGTKIDMDKTNGDRVVLTLSYHHMDNNGFYDGWTEHSITVAPTWHGPYVRSVSGRNRDDIKDYLADIYTDAMRSTALDRASLYPADSVKRYLATLTRRA